MMNMIDELHYQFPYYGYWKMQAALYHREIIINHKRVQRLMNILYQAVCRYGISVCFN